MNKARDFEVARIKKEWNRSKDVHLGFLEETPFRMTWADNSYNTLVAKDFSFPMINMGSLHRKKQSLSKGKNSIGKIHGHRRPKTNLDSDFDRSLAEGV